MLLPGCNCCGGVVSECECTGTVSLELNPGCEIDYIAVDFEFRFTECGDLPVTGSLTLNQDNYWLTGGYFADENECNYDVSIGIGCFEGEYIMTISIQRVLTPGFGDCCRDGIYLCDDAPSSTANVSPTFTLPAVLNGENCCPGILESWEWADAGTACPGATVKITGMTKVML